MARKNREFWESAEFNNKTFNQYYNRLMNLAISMFEWKNLPDSVDPRFLELCLFGDGMAIFFRDEVMGELALQCMINGPLDVYRIPINRRAYATNGYNKALTNKDSVIIFNNELHTNSMLDVEMYAKRLYKLERTIDVNVEAQKTPIIVTCPENQRLTFKNLLMQYEGGQPFIWGDANLDLKQIQVLNTSAPFVSDKIQALKTQIWNEALTSLGITSLGNEKKERMVSDEVSSDMGSTMAQRFTRLNARQEACKKINKMFGLSISVDYREDVIHQITGSEPVEENEVME